MAVATALTIGNFDGAHLGHAALVARARELVGVGGRVVALSFDPSPASVLRPGAEPARLTTFGRRAELLGALGVDEVVRLEPTRELLGWSPEEFVGRVAGEWAPDVIVEGADFRFGRGRSGDVETLRRLGESHGFAVDVVDPVRVALSDQSVVVASSSVARWLLERGRVRDLAAVLGRPYELGGEVVRGDRLGRTIGFPTANVACETALPADGVYAGVARLADGRRFGAALSVGTRETFDGEDRRVEAYLLGTEGGEEREDGAPHPGPLPRGEREAEWSPLPGLPEYGWRVSIELVGWVRDQARFASVEALVEQIGRDCERVGEALALSGVSATVGGRV
ncbi:MAG: bifunctional riboflavin kinase/FMN adenylyltransferase [Phycisphaerales bacterium]